MKMSFLRSGTALKVTAFLAIAAPTALLTLPGCSGGGSGGVLGGGGGGGGGVIVTQRLNGSVQLPNFQTGALAVTVRSDNSANGTFTITNNPVNNVRSAQLAAAFTTGVYQLSGSYDPSTGRVQLSGNITNFGPFSIDVTPPSGSTNGSFVAAFNGETFNGIIPVVVVPTPVPTTTGTPVATNTPGPTATPRATSTPAPTGQVPQGHGPLTISLTSSNSTLSGGNITNQIGASAVSDQVGNAYRINMVNGTGTGFPIKLFNFLIAKQGPIKAGDTLNVIGSAGSNDVVTLLVTSTSGAKSYRGQSGSLKINSVSGKTVSFTITGLKMVDETNASSSFNLSGSGSFTLN